MVDKNKGNGGSIEFGEDELRALINLEVRLKENEKALESLEEDCKAHKLEIDDLKMVLANMIWASSKVALIAGSGFGGLVWLGYWLMDAVHWKAIVGFFKTLRGE